MPDICPLSGFFIFVHLSIHMRPHQTTWIGLRCSMKRTIMHHHLLARTKDQNRILRHRHQEKLNKISKLTSQRFHTNIRTSLLKRVKGLDKFAYESQGMIKIKLNHYSLKVVKKFASHMENSYRRSLKTRNTFKFKETCIE